MTPFPADIRSITSLRYLAAIWVVAFHFSVFTGSTTLRENPLVMSGYLGVDFFFVLSGFVLTHVYRPKIESERFDYWMFLVRRFGRVYPLHIVTLGLFVVLGIAGRLNWITLSDHVKSVSFSDQYGPEIFRALIANLTLIHAWGATDNLRFNLPSWSISAEWFAYMLFPVFVMIDRALLRAPGVKTLLVAIAFVVAATLLAKVTHTELTRLSWNAGILRIFPEFLLGMVLYRLGEQWSAGGGGALLGLCGSLAVAIAAIIVAATYNWLAPAFSAIAVLGLSGLVFFAADADRCGRLALAKRKFPVLLGEISYSVYMIHLGVGILLFDVAFPQWRPTNPLIALATVAGASALVTLLSWFTYTFIELPGRSWIVARGRGFYRPENLIAP